MKRDGNGYTLSTGKEFYANGGILGIAEDGVYEGYDGTIETHDYDEDWYSDGIDVRLTQEEAVEIAECAKAMWDAWLERRWK